MVNYYLIYLFSVLLLMGLVITNYDQILVSLGMQINEDQGFFKDLEITDTPENRVFIANILIIVSAVFAPLVLLLLLASRISDSGSK